MWFSQAPWYSLPVHLCRFRVRSSGGLFPGTSKRPPQSDKGKQSSRSVTSSWPRNINLVPIDYAFRPRLRGRLTLLRLALSRNPWIFGRGSLTPFVVTHVIILTSDLSTGSLTGRLHRKLPASNIPRRALKTLGTMSHYALLPCNKLHPRLRLMA